MIALPLKKKIRDFFDGLSAPRTALCPSSKARCASRRIATAPENSAISKCSDGAVSVNEGSICDNKNGDGDKIHVHQRNVKCISKLWACNSPLTARQHQ